MKSTYFMECKKVLGVGLKQYLWRYCISYVYFLYLVIFVWSKLGLGLDNMISNGLPCCYWNYQFHSCQV